MVVSDSGELRRLRIHGHERAFIMMGQGPVILLLHGIGMTHKTWDKVIPALSQNFTVIAPDLLGHGESDKPRADYSLGGYANGMRDLLELLEIDRVTVVGHSLGGGVAMQFAYQYPHMVERFVLVGSGGLGRSVNPAIRALTIPGAGPVMAVAAAHPIRRVSVPALWWLHATGWPGTQDLGGFAEVYESMGDKGSRSAFRHVLRAAVDWRGQVLTMFDRAYLAEHIPAMIMWGYRDMAIPVRHAYAAKEMLPRAWLHIFSESGHMPHEDEPESFAEALREFVTETKPARWVPDGLREAMKGGAPVRRRPFARVPEQEPREFVPSADQSWSA